MPRNVYFSQGTTPEKRLYEDITIEALKIYGHDVYYIPRKIVNTNSIFNEDALSEFGSAYQIEMYVENTDGFEGDGDLLSKFGVEVRDSMTLVIATKRWEQLVGRFQNPVEARPQEGDLIYFPLVKGLFQITFVEDESPFYQIANLPTFKLSCELFEYGDEAIDTGVEEIDAFETAYATRTSLTLGMGSGSYINGEDLTQTIGSLTISGEVAETTQNEVIGNLTYSNNVYVYDATNNYFNYATPGGLLRFSKTNHFTGAVGAGAIEGEWAYYRIDTENNFQLAPDDTFLNLGTGQFPNIGTVDYTPLKISVYGIKSSDGSNTNFATTTGSAGNIVGSKSAASYAITTEDAHTSLNDNDPYSDNEDFETIGNNFIDFSESNPFGEINITS